MSACYLCGGSTYKALFSTREVRTGDAFSIAECMSCGLVVTLPFLSLEEVRPYYAMYYGDRKSIFDVCVNIIRARQVERYGEKGRILDIGCGTGSFLHSMRRRGWDTHGTEVSDLDLAKIREHSGAAVYANEELRKLPSASFQVVTLWHVFEHLADPAGYLRYVQRILAPNGLFIIEVPSFSSWQAGLGGSRWLNLDVPRHTMHLTPKTITAFLEKTGFVVERVSFGSLFYDVFGTVQTLLDMITNCRYLLFDVLGGRVDWRDHKKDFCVALIATPFFFSLACALFPVSALFKKGGIMTVFARKKDNVFL